MEYRMIKPDFRTWAENITLVARKYGTAHESIEVALEQAFDQGYKLGLNKGWAIEQDKCYQQKTADSMNEAFAKGYRYEPPKEN